MQGLRTLVHSLNSLSNYLVDYNRVICKSIFEADLTKTLSVETDEVQIKMLVV